jgi:four helix bundle protein
MTYRRFDHGFRKLIAWQESHKLSVAIYKVTKSFPSCERYGITDQLRRASSSMGAQIAEGSRMSTAAHRSIFYERAYASAAEVDNFLELALDLEYLLPDPYRELLAMVNRASYLITRLSASLARKPSPPPTIPTIPTLHTLHTLPHKAPIASPQTNFS